MTRRAAGLLCATLVVFVAPTALADDPEPPARITPDSDDEFGEEAEPEKKAEPEKAAEPEEKAEPAPAAPAEPATPKVEPEKPAVAPTAPKAEPEKPAVAPTAPKAEPEKAAPGAEAASCQTHGDCVTGLMCVTWRSTSKLTCSKRCTEDANCTAGFVCSQGAGSARFCEPQETATPTPAATAAQESAAEATEVAPQEPKEEAKKEEPKKKAAKKEEDPPVIEGELAAVGALGFVPFVNRIGTRFAVEQLGETAFLGIQPTVNYSTKLLDRPLSLTFAVPLRIELVDARVDKRFKNTGRFRKEDWDEASDFFQVINAITYGGKEGHVYVDINAFKSTSIGHGTLVKRYNPNLNFNTARVQAEVDAFTDYVGGELYVDNIVGPNVLGGLVFVKPLSFIDRDNYIMRSFSLGVQMFTDINAPVRNILDWDDADNDGKRWNEIAVDQETFQPEHTKSMVLAYGLDAEIKLIDERWLDWKTYVDYSFLETGVPTSGVGMDDCLATKSRAECLDYYSVPLLDAPGMYNNVSTEPVRAGGFTWGHLFRMNFGKRTIHAVRMRFEYRNHDPNYQPSYFDSLYDVQRVQHPASKDLINLTKLQQVLGRSADGARVHGGYFELSYSMSHYFAMSLGFETNDTTPDNAMFVHLEVPKLGPWAFMATYQRRNAETLGTLFDAEFKSTDWFLAQTRFSIVDILNLALEVVTPFGLGSESLGRNDLQVNFIIELGFKYL